MKFYFLLIFLLSAGIVNAQSGTLRKPLTQKTDGSPVAGRTGRRIVFAPDRFYSVFSSKIPPVLHIVPGDTVQTESMDANGVDRNNIQRVKEGSANPLTGPFYIEGAMPGDVVAVHITKLHINRARATGAGFFVPRSLPDSILKKLPNAGAMNRDPAVQWVIDTLAGQARPANAHAHLQHFSVPLKPMLGCVGLAPKGKEISTEDAGPFGGNMDFSRITKGAIVYLPVSHPGGLLFMGDAHALQGDGELNMAALEISMDFEFTTALIPHQEMQIDYPRIEDSTDIMTVGLAEHLDEAFKIANAGMLGFLQKEYDLSDVEAAQVMGTSLEYQIPEITDPQVEVVAKIKKNRLALLKRHTGNQ